MGLAVFVRMLVHMCVAWCTVSTCICRPMHMSFQMTQMTHLRMLTTTYSTTYSLAVCCCVKQPPNTIINSGYLYSQCTR